MAAVLLLPGSHSEFAVTPQSGLDLAASFMKHAAPERENKKASSPSGPPVQKHPRRAVDDMSGDDEFEPSTSARALSPFAAIQGSSSAGGFDMSIITTAIAEASAKMQEAVLSVVRDEQQKRLDAYDRRWTEQQRDTDEKIAAQAARTAEHDRVFENHDREIAKLRERLDVMQKDLQVAASTTSPSVPIDGDFDRSLDHTILVARSKELVARTAMEHAIQELGEIAGIAGDKWEIVKGEDLAKHFTIKFKGSPAIAGKLVFRMHSAVRISPGKFRDLVVETPDHAPSTFFLDRDKNKKMLGLERAFRVLRRILNEEFPDQDIRGKKSDAIFFNNKWEAIVKIECPSPDEYILRYDGNNELARDIRASQAPKKFKNALASPESRVSWI